MADRSARSPPPPRSADRSATAAGIGDHLELGAGRYLEHPEPLVFVGDVGDVATSSAASSATTATREPLTSSRASHRQRSARSPPPPPRPATTSSSAPAATSCSSGCARNDLIKKKRACHRNQVGHYWLVDPVDETLTVHRWYPDDYVEVLIADRDERVRAEPFEAIELRVATLFGDDDEDDEG